MKHLALAALVIAGLLLSAAIRRPQPASAGLGPSDSCTALSGVDASGSTPDLHKYSYDLLGCPFGSHVQGEYNVGQHTAHEVLSSSDPDDYPYMDIDDWICPSGDPWSWSADTPPAPCKIINGSQLSFPAAPRGTVFLGVFEHNALAYALNVVLTKQAAFLATEVTPVTPSGAILAAQQAGQEAAQQAAFLTTQVTPVTAAGSAAASVLGSTLTPALAPAPATYHAPSIVAGWPQLSLYTQGEAVTSLQYLMQKSAPTLTVDGTFGTTTDAAVRAFQKSQVPPLTADGQVGQQTWLALIVTVQQGSQGAAVKAVQSQLNVQSRLNARGGQAVVVDGSFGAQTDAAVKAYQQSHQQSDGLVVDGQVGPQTWPVLLSGK